MTSDELFLKSIKEVEHLLNRMQFTQSYFERKGFAIFIQYSRQTTVVEFMFGPPEYHVEMFITKLKGHYAFKDLLQIPEVTEWIKSNKFKQEKESHIKAEILWFINLLEFVLPLIE